MILCGGKKDTFQAELYGGVSSLYKQYSKNAFFFFFVIGCTKCMCICIVKYLVCFEIN